MNDPVTTLLLLKQRADTLPPTLMGNLEEYFKHVTPFMLLVSCILSLRSRDTNTYKVCCVLFSEFTTPLDFITVSLEELCFYVKSVNYYKRKANVIKSIASIIHTLHKDQVPSNKEHLLALPGVGIKTMSLIQAEAFNIPSVCVDTHVQKISTLLGWTNNTDPKKIKEDLEKLFDKKYWNMINDVLVRWGQNRCTLSASQCCYHTLCTIIYRSYKRRVDHTILL